jgi:hypothetical protein
MPQRYPETLCSLNTAVPPFAFRYVSFLYHTL